MVVTPLSRYQRCLAMAMVAFQVSEKNKASKQKYKVWLHLEDLPNCICISASPNLCSGDIEVLEGTYAGVAVEAGSEERDQVC